MMYMIPAFRVCVQICSKSFLLQVAILQKQCKMVLEGARWQNDVGNHGVGLYIQREIELEYSFAFLRDAELHVRRP